MDINFTWLDLIVQLTQLLTQIVFTINYKMMHWGKGAVIVMTRPSEFRYTVCTAIMEAEEQVQQSCTMTFLRMEHKRKIMTAHFQQTGSDKHAVYYLPSTKCQAASRWRRWSIHQTKEKTPFSEVLLVNIRLKVARWPETPPVLWCFSE